MHVWSFLGLIPLYTIFSWVRLPIILYLSGNSHAIFQVSGIRQSQYSNSNKKKRSLEIVVGTLMFWHFTWNEFQMPQLSISHFILIYTILYGFYDANGLQHPSNLLDELVIWAKLFSFKHKILLKLILDGGFEYISARLK